MKTQLLTLGVAAIALGFSGVAAEAETVHTKTVVQTKETEGVNNINFSDFDTNKDGKYSMKEVGEKLFYIFDQDGNEVIDNIEWSAKNVYTITPMEKETFQYVDYNDDGMAEEASYTHEMFWKESGLMRFDNDADGLSAGEFIQVGYQELDDNDNNIIELEEWKEAYIQMIKPANAEPERYN